VTLAAVRGRAISRRDTNIPTSARLPECNDGSEEHILSNLPAFAAARQS
jgi:hypothetical protein